MRGGVEGGDEGGDEGEGDNNKVLAYLSILFLASAAFSICRTVLFNRLVLDSSCKKHQTLTCCSERSHTADLHHRSQI